MDGISSGPGGAGDTRSARPRTNGSGSRDLARAGRPGARGTALALVRRVISRAVFTLPGTAHLSPRSRRALKIALAALLGIPWIPLAAALYAWTH